ncbi:methionine tRS [Acrasis kona]|uniref:Methionine tRS n=1 Tax=Acrasis kona TaxID=1008807 RepID=A0AAW2ZR65_9EUKA
MELCGCKPLSLALVFFIVIGMTMTAFGVVFLVLSPPLLQPELVEYNSVVNLWNEKHMSHFSEFQFNLTRYLGKDVQVPYVLDQDKTLDRIHYDGSQDVRRPDPLKYSLKRSAFYPNLVAIDFSMVLELDITYGYYGEEVSIRTNDYDGTTVKYPVFLQIPMYRKSDSDCAPGFPDGEECYYAYAIRSVCLKVKEIKNGILELDTKYGGVGCSPGDALLGTDQMWPGAKYRFIDFGTNETNVGLHMTDLSDMVVSVRSTEDPYVFANKITNGTLSFVDFEQNYVPYITVTRGFIGFGSVGLGVLLFFPALFCFTFCCCKKDTRHLMIDNMTEEHHMMLTMKSSVAVQNWSDFLYPKSSYPDKV